MWRGVLPAVTTKFKDDGSLDHEEMIRCFGIQMDAGVDGLIACGSLGEGPMLSHDERIEVLTPIRRPELKQQIAELLELLLNDERQGWRLIDRTWERDQDSTEPGVQATLLARAPFS